MILKIDLQRYIVEYAWIWHIHIYEVAAFNPFMVIKVHHCIVGFCFQHSLTCLACPCMVCFTTVVLSRSALPVLVLLLLLQRCQPLRNTLTSILN